MSAQTLAVEQTISSESDNSTFVINLLLATAVAGTLDAIAGIVVFDFTQRQIRTVHRKIRLKKDLLNSLSQVATAPSRDIR